MPKSKFHVGMMQAWIDVAKYYYATIAQTVVLTGVLKFNQLTWGEIGLILGGILVLVCVVGILHMKFIYPKHASYLYNKNPVIQEFRKEFAKIEKAMTRKDSWGRMQTPTTPGQRKAKNPIFNDVDPEAFKKEWESGGNINIMRGEYTEEEKQELRQQYQWVDDKIKELGYETTGLKFFDYSREFGIGVSNGKTPPHRKRTIVRINSDNEGAFPSIESQIKDMQKKLGKPASS